MLFLGDNSQLEFIAPVLRRLQTAEWIYCLQLVCVPETQSTGQMFRGLLQSVVNVHSKDAAGIREQLGYPPPVTAMIFDPCGKVAAKDVPIAKLHDKLVEMRREREIVVSFYTWDDWTIVYPRAKAEATQQGHSKEAFRQTVASHASKRDMAHVVWDKRALPRGLAETDLRQEIEGILKECGYRNIAFTRAISAATTTR